MSDNFKYVAVAPKRLASGLSSSASTVALTDIDGRDGTALAMTDFGDLGFACIDPGRSNMELISFTGVSGASLTGVSRGLSFKSPYTNVAALQLPHAAGAKVVFSNTPQFYDQLSGKDDDESVTGIWTFDSTATPRSSAAHTYGAGEEEFFATKRYADSLAIAGAPNASTTAKGIVEEATQAEMTAGTNVGGTGARLFPAPSTVATALQNRSNTYAVDAVGTDSYAITLTPAVTAYADGQCFTFKAGTANTGAATLNVNGLGAVTIKKLHDQDLETGDIESGSVCMVQHDGTNFQLLSVQASMPTTAILSEMSTFFGATDITGAEAETLSSGSTSDAIALHKHSSIKAETTFLANPSDTNENTIVTYSLGAGRLGSKSGFRIRYHFAFSGNGFTCNIKFKYGSTSVFTFALGDPSTATHDHTGELYIFNTSTTAQAYKQFGIKTISTGANPVVEIANGTAAVDTTGALTISVTATMSNSSAGLSSGLVMELIDRE